jgi:hypothetical protein
MKHKLLLISSQNAMKKVVTRKNAQINTTRRLIVTDKDYINVMNEIESLVVAGGGNIEEKDLEEYSQLARTAQQYEQSKYIIDPTTIR